MKRQENLVLAIVGCSIFLALALLALLATEDAAGIGAEGTPGSPHSEAARGTRRLRVAFERAGHEVLVAKSDEDIPREAVVLLIEPTVGLSDSDAQILVWAVQFAGLRLVVAGNHHQLSLLPEELLPSELPGVTRTIGPDVASMEEGLPFAPRVAGVLALGPDASDPRRLNAIHCFNDDVPGMDTIAKAVRSRRPVVVGTTMGAGSVILCSEPRLFENQWLHQLQNIELAAALTCSETTIVFDERWRSIDNASPPMTAMLYGTGPGRGVVIVTLAAMLALFLAGLYPGGAPRANVKRRRPMQYVDSMAKLVLGAGSPATLITHFQTGLRRRACRRLRLQPDVPLERVAGLIADRTGADEREVFRVLSAIPPPDQVPRWVALMDSWEKLL